MDFHYEMRNKFNISSLLASKLVSASNNEVHLAGDIIRTSQGYTSHIYFVLSGIAYTSSYRDSNNHLYNLLTEGQIVNVVGATMENKLSFEFHALTDVRLLAIPSGDAIAIFNEDAEFSRLIATSCALFMTQANLLIEMQRLKCQKSKLKAALFLLFQISSQVSVPVTIIQLANLLTISRSTATKAAKELELKKEIKLHYGRVEKGDDWDESWNPLGQVIFPIS